MNPLPDAAAHSNGPGPARLSVVIACKDAAHILPRCLASLAAQTALPHEVVLKDALSADGTADLPARWPALPIRLIRSADTGIYDAWNQALAAVTGDWVLFLGADDALADPDTLASVGRLLASMPPSVEVAYGQVLLSDALGEHVERLGRPWRQIAADMRHRMMLPHPGTFHRTSLFRRIGGFDPALRIAGDYELLLRATKDRDAVFLDMPVTRMWDGGMSSLPSNNLKLAREMARIVGRHGERNMGYWTLMGRYLGTWAMGCVLGDRLTMNLRRRVRRKPRESMDKGQSFVGQSLP